MSFRCLRFLPILALASSAPVPTVEVAAGVHMPVLNLGTCCGSKPSVGVVPWVAAQHGSVAGIDTAWDYFDQAKVGKGIVDSGAAREDIFLLTKVPPVLDVMTKVKDDLKQLGLAQADIILLHNPTTKAENAKQYAALEQALAMNLTRAIGISDFSKAQVAALLETANVIPAVNQCEMSVGHHDDENIAFCQANNITYEAWNVLKGCDRTDPTVLSVAQAHNVSTFQVCLRFIVDRGAVMAVGTGKDASTVGSFTAENLGIFDFKLTADEMTQLNDVAAASAPSADDQ